MIGLQRRGLAITGFWLDEAREVGRQVLVRMACERMLAEMQGPQDERACRPVTAVALVLGLGRGPAWWWTSPAWARMYFSE